MGVPGLWPLLDSTSTSITLDILEGKRLAVDISFWLHQAAQGYINAGNRPDTKYPHLTILIRRIAKLLFYKIRPVFVFDGPAVPVFKRQILRDRALKRHLDDLIVDDRQKRRILEQVARASESGEALADAVVGSSPTKRTRRSADSDIFALPSTSPTTDEKPKLGRIAGADRASVVEDYLDGYETLLTSDERVNFLVDAKERYRVARLRSDEIPDDSKAFSDFQLKRLLNRNKINTQLEMIRKDHHKQSVKFSEDRTKIMVVDNQLRSHVLLHNEDVRPIDPEREARQRMLMESLSWPEFLRQMDEAKTKTSVSRYETAKIDDDDEKDDALQEAILASMAEMNGLTEASFRKLPESGFRFGINSSLNEIYQDNWSSASSESDYDFQDYRRGNGMGGGFTFAGHSLDSLQAMEFMSDQDESSASSSSSVQEKQQGQVEERDDNEVESNEYFRLKNDQQLEGNNFLDDQRGIYAECQTLLSFLGVPYLQAPAEAEAQCVELERLGLVDGVVTDDSDVWLFGGSVVYKNMFSHARHVQEFRAQRLLETFGLSRSEFIQIGMLSGGDYTRGFKKVGVVTALELISEFLSTKETEIVGNDSPAKLLEKIGEWLRAGEKSKSGKRTESKTQARLRKIIEVNNEKMFIESFPNMDVYNAYANPAVNSSDQRFAWNCVQFEKLNEFLWSKIGWTPEKLDHITHHAFRRWNEFVCQTRPQYQIRMDTFLQRCDPLAASPDTDPKDSREHYASPLLAPTIRVQMALAKLKSRTTARRKLGETTRDEK